MDSNLRRHAKYNKKRRNKSVSFLVDEESDLLEFADSVDFSVWVKRKIAEEIKDNSASNASA